MRVARKRIQPLFSDPAQSKRSTTPQLNNRGEISLHLQNTFENQVIQRMSRVGAEEPRPELTTTVSPRVEYDFSRIPIHHPPAKVAQTKLAISKPEDSDEQEAERVADQVMATPTHPDVSGPPACVQSVPGQRNGKMNAAPASIDRTLSDSGRPLEEPLRHDMELRFGHDFGHVRVHSDQEAARSASDYDARAYTVGSDIVFGAREYAPETLTGRRLIAHELTHVVQQESHKTAAPAVQRAPEGGTGTPPTVAKPLPESLQSYTEDADEDISSLNDEDLANDILRLQQTMLSACLAGLTNFATRMTSKTDKESNPDFSKAMGKFFREQAVGHFEPVLKWAVGEISEKAFKPTAIVVDAFKTLSEEAARAQEAKESATLRDFIEDHTRYISDMQTNLGIVGGPFARRVREISAAMSRSKHRTKGKAALADAEKKYEAMHSALRNAYSDLLSRTKFSKNDNVLQLLMEEWIRGSMVRQGWGMKHAVVVMRMNKDFSIKDAHIQGTGGQNIAEELLGIAMRVGHADGVNFYQMAVPKEIEYFGHESPYPSAYLHLDEYNHIHGYEPVGDPGGEVEKVWEYIRSNGAKALVTKKVEGD